MYSYYDEMASDIREAITNGDYNLRDYSDRDEAEEKLNDAMWIDDSITGNASGSYTMNRNTAREYVTDNLDLLKEAAQEFGCTDRADRWLFDEEWEDADVTIRCYLLGQALSAVLDEFDGVWDEEEDEEPETLSNIA